MLKNYINLSQFKLGKTLDKFSMALNLGHFSVRKDFALVFLCGANQVESIPSARRTFLKSTIEKNLPHVKVVYAEAVMEELTREGKAKNLLDIEEKISQIADSILIILESNSTYCELGAFSNMKFREKLIVINDSQYKNVESFINLGPLQAIEESGNGTQILWYPMSSDGIKNLDSIGMVLPSVLREIRNHTKHRPINHYAFLPKAENQSALFFLHDLIHLCGPVKHSEIVDIYIKLFGDHPFDDIKQLRGILHASNLIMTKKEGKETYYQSIANETFINFEHFEKELLGLFRRFHLKYNPRRLFS